MRRWRRPKARRSGSTDATDQTAAALAEEAATATRRRSISRPSRWARLGSPGLLLAAVSGLVQGYFDHTNQATAPQFTLYTRFKSVRKFVSFSFLITVTL